MTCFSLRFFIFFKCCPLIKSTFHPDILEYYAIIPKGERRFENFSFKKESGYKWELIDSRSKNKAKSSVNLVFRDFTYTNYKSRKIL